MWTSKAAVGAFAALLVIAVLGTFVSSAPASRQWHAAVAAEVDSDLDGLPDATDNDGTLTRTFEGVVSVRDLVRRTTVLVAAGKTYLAHGR